MAQTTSNIDFKMSIGQLSTGPLIHESQERHCCARHHADINDAKNDINDAKKDNACKNVTWTSSTHNVDILFVFGIHAFLVL